MTSLVELKPSGGTVANIKKEQRYIVDRDITDNVIDGIFLTIQDAVDSAY